MAVYTNTAIDAIREEYMADHVENTRLARQYDAGDHFRMITGQQRHMLFGQKLNAMADNIVRLILTTAASRVTFEGWSIDEPASDDADDDDPNRAGPVQRYLDDLMRRAQLGRKQYDVHRAMLRDGNHALSLGWRNGRVMIHRERWWDGETGVFVAYDRDEEYEFAVREWNQRQETGSTLARRNVYYPDHFLRYVKQGSGWELITESDPANPAQQSQNGTVKWEKRPGDPLGIPIVHFPNGSYEDTPYGQSDIIGLLGLQDELNSIQHDIAAAAKYTGFQMYWTAGARSSAGKLRIGPGRLFEFDAPEAKMGVVPAGDMTALTDAHSYKRSTMAIDSSTPMHTVNGKDWPSGEALINAEKPLVDKAGRLDQIVAPQWAMVGHRSVELGNAFGGLQLDEDAPITTMMADPRHLDELAIARIDAEKARTMELVSRIGDVALLRELDFLDADVITSLIAERTGVAEASREPVAQF